MKSVLIAIFLSVPLAALASAPAASKTAVANACGPNSTRFELQKGPQGQLLGPPPNGMANVYVVEKDAFGLHKHSFGIKTRVGLDGHWIGGNFANGYAAFTVSAGNHHLCSNWQTKFFYNPQPTYLTSFTAEAGHTYYFTAAVYEGKSAPFPIVLKRVSANEGRYLLSTARRSISKAKHR